MGNSVAGLHEFLAIVTHPRIYVPPTPLPRALDQVDAWLESPSLVLIAETTAHWPTLMELMLAGRIAGPQVHDGRVAALCRQHGANSGRPTATSAALAGSP